MYKRMLLYYGDIKNKLFLTVQLYSFIKKQIVNKD